MASVNEDLTSESKKPEGEQSEKNEGRATVLKLYYQPKFSDVKIFAGEEKRCFELHRAIITLNSKYFEAACKEFFQEGKTGEIYLAEIEPEAFEVVALWMYEGGYGFPDPFDKQLIQDVFVAADYLQIRDLKKDIIKTAGDYWRLPSERRNGTDAFALWEIFCSYSQLTDWKELRELTTAIVNRWYVDTTMILHLSRGGSALALGLMVEAYENIIRSVLCDPCQMMHRPADGKRCMKCGKSCVNLEYVDASESEQN